MRAFALHASARVCIRPAVFLIVAQESCLDTFSEPPPPTQVGNPPPPRNTKGKHCGQEEKTPKESTTTYETQRGNIAAKKKKHQKNPPPHTKHKGETLWPRRKNTKRIHRRTQNTKGKHCGPKEITPEEGLNGLPSPLLLGLLSPPACSPFAAMRKH
jgi:hypothetical protein